MTEQDLVNSIVEYIQAMGGVATRINSGGMPKEGKNGSRYFIKMAPKGTADIIACWQGKYIAIEAKLPGNTTTQDQEAFLQSVRDAGGVAIVAYSFEDVIQIIG